MEYLEEIVRVEAEILGSGVAVGQNGPDSSAALRNDNQRDQGKNAVTRKFAVLPTVGGQTALNLAVDLADSGVLERFGCGVDRREAGGDQEGGGPAAVQGRDDQDRAGYAQVACW